MKTIKHKKCSAFDSPRWQMILNLKASIADLHAKKEISNIIEKAAMMNYQLYNLYCNHILNKIQYNQTMDKLIDAILITIQAYKQLDQEIKEQEIQALNKIIAQTEAI